MDFDKLEKVIGQNTPLLWLCNPQNPIGKAWSRDDLEKLSDICLRRGVLILSDDVNSGLTYNGTQYSPIASLSEASAKNTVTCMSASKTYNVTGSKHSFVIIPDSGVREDYCHWLNKIGIGYGKDAIGLAATEAALSSCEPWRKELVECIEGTASFVADFLSDRIPEATMVKPEATYFAWIDFGFLGLEGQAFTDLFEREARVVIEPGSDFGLGGDGFISMNLGCQRALVSEGLERIVGAVDAIK